MTLAIMLLGVAVTVSVALGMICFVRFLEWEAPCDHSVARGQIFTDDRVDWECAHCEHKWSEPLPDRLKGPVIW